MDLTLIRDREGHIIAAALGHVSDSPPTGRSPEIGAGPKAVDAGPMAVDGQTFEKVVAPDEFEELRRDPAEFGRRLKKYFGDCSC